MLALVLQFLSALISVVSLVLALWKGGAGDALKGLVTDVAGLKIKVETLENAQKEAHGLALEHENTKARLKSAELEILGLRAWRDNYGGKTNVR